MAKLTYYGKMRERRIRRENRKQNKIVFYSCKCIEACLYGILVPILLIWWVVDKIAIKVGKIIPHLAKIAFMAIGGTCFVYLVVLFAWAIA